MHNRHACEALIHMVLVVFVCCWSLCVSSDVMLSVTNKLQQGDLLTPTAQHADALTSTWFRLCSHSHTHAHAPGATDVLHMLTETPTHTYGQKNVRLSRAACICCHVQPMLIYLRCLSHKDYFILYFPYMLNCTLRLQLTLHNSASP